MKDPHHGVTEALRKYASRLPGTEEGVACKGTSLERISVKARKKAFLFLGKGDAMVKLRDSLPDAAKRALKDPERYKAGAGGWVTVRFHDGEPAVAVLEQWIEESYRLIAGPQPTSPSRKTRKASGKRNRES